jgi:hypothetical protein
LATCIYYTWQHMDACKNTRVQLDTCIITRVYLDTCILYTRPIKVFIPLAMLSERHVASWTRVYSNRYCRHTSNCSIFCSVGTEHMQHGLFPRSCSESRLLQVQEGATLRFPSKFGRTGAEHVFRPATTN